MSRYQEYLASDVWIKRRDRVLQRAKGMCERCGFPAWHVHHKTYARIFNENDDDLIAICVPCHSLEHNKLKNHEEIAKVRWRQRNYSDRKLQKLYSNF